MKAKLTAAAVLCALAAAPVPDAGASARSIKATFKAYTPRIRVAEGHLVAASAEYAQSQVAAPLQRALEEYTAVLAQLEKSVAAQGTPTARVKKARRDVVGGLKAEIVAYRRLSTAIGQANVSTAQAKAEVQRANAAAKVGAERLIAGIKLLKH